MNNGLSFCAPSISSEIIGLAVWSTLVLSGDGQEKKKVSKEGAKKARVANLISLSDTFKIRPREIIVTDPLQEEPLTKIEHELENG